MFHYSSSGSWFQSLWKIWKSIGMIISSTWKNISHVPVTTNNIYGWQLPSQGMDRNGWCQPRLPRWEVGLDIHLFHLCHSALLQIHSTWVLGIDDYTLLQLNTGHELLIMLSMIFDYWIIWVQIIILAIVAILINHDIYWSIIMIRSCIDDEEYEKYLLAASKWMPAFHCRLVDFCPARQPQAWDSLDVRFGHCEWVFVKLTGAWPLRESQELHGLESRGSGRVSTLCCSACRCCSHATAIIAAKGMRRSFYDQVWVTFYRVACIFGFLIHSMARILVDTARVRYVGLVFRWVMLA